MGSLNVRLSSGDVVAVSVSKVKPNLTVEPVEIVEVDEHGDVLFSLRKTNHGQLFEKFSWVKVKPVTIKEDGSERIEMREIKPKKISRYAVDPETGERKKVVLTSQTSLIYFDKDHMFPATYTDVMLAEGMYELYSTDPEIQKLLKREADNALEQDIAYYFENFAWRKGGKQYYAILYPKLFPENKFVWILKTSRGRSRFTNLMEVEDTEIAEKIEKLPSIMEQLIEVK